MTRSFTIALLLALAASTAHAQDDPAACGDFLVRAERLKVNAGGKTYVDLRLPAGASVARPVVLLSPGWAAGTGDFTAIAEHLASRGFAVAIFEEKDSWSGDIEKRAKNLKTAIDELTRANADPKSGVFGELDLGRLAIMGHSYGGAAAIVAAAEDPRIKAVVALAPVSQWHRARLLTRSSQLNVPLLVLRGSSDPLATSGGYAKPIIAAARNAPREYVEIKGVGHSFFQNGGAGMAEHADADRYATAWLERFLEGKKDAGGYTDGTAANGDRGVSDHAVADVPSTVGLAGALR